MENVPLKKTLSVHLSNAICEGSTKTVIWWQPSKEKMERRKPKKCRLKNF